MAAAARGEAPPVLRLGARGARLQHDILVLLLLLQLLKKEAQKEPTAPEPADDGNLSHRGPDDAVHLERRG